MTTKSASRTCFIATVLVLLWSVFVFGGVADGYRTVAGLMTAACGVLCLVLLPRERRVPPHPWVLVGALGFLLVYGWFMVLNAVAEHSLEFWQFTAVENRLIGVGPGSVARSTSQRSLVELTCVCLGMLGVLRATESPAWKRLVELFAVFGGLVALTGILHKVGGAEAVYWMDDEQPALFFAPYVYNANAGAFMNLCFPLAFGLAVARVGDDHGRAAGGFWAMVAVVTAAGVVVAASKGAIIILAVSLPCLVVWNRRRLGELLGSFRSQRGRRIERSFQVVLLTVLALLFLAIGIGVVVLRWDEFLGRFDDPDRAITGREGIMKLMWRMAGPAEGSWHGFGPGAFRHLVPYFTVGEAGKEVSAGRWLHGHSDPLQTMVEWGWIGAAAWFAVGVGAVVSGLLLLRKNRLRVDEVPVIRGVVLALVLVGGHSCIDFPLSIYSIHLAAMMLCGICWGLAKRRSAMDEG